MALSTKTEYFTADGQSTIKVLRAIIFTSTTADTLDLKDGSSGGSVKMSFAVAAGGTTGVSLPDGGITISTGTGWYADVTTTGAPKITLIGD
jgi:hypothetical protein